LTEHHKVPVAWLRIRLCYAHSIAATSVVRHVLNLGNRHISGVSQAMTNGKVVELGIEFDQGKLFPGPEYAPFRPTAGMMVGLGTSGADGVAEKALCVLREGQGIALTVLEAFKYDPSH
ncbi:uncharacterized protein PHACADRAFT_57869, partial [Phanerochaete carnosa HHB-10118-sp]